MRYKRRGFHGPGAIKYKYYQLLVINLKKTVILISILCLLVGFIFFLNHDLMTPYVSIKDARETEGEYVQIVGRLDRSRRIRTHKDGSYSFTVGDHEGERMQIRAVGEKPEKMELFEQFVIMGRYDKKKKLFKADKVITNDTLKTTDKTRD